MLILFLDESGDHNLQKIDPSYPVFILGGCVIDEAYHQETVASEMDKNKMRLFAQRDFIIHTADITRRRGVFRSLTDQAFRKHFYEETNDLMRRLDYQVIACAVLKDAHLRKYGLSAIDPYILALHILIERFIFEKKNRHEYQPSYIVAESRNDTLDYFLRLAWTNVRAFGTQYLTPAQVEKNISDLHIRNKKENIAGLQLADLVVSPIGRLVIGKQVREDWEIVRNKMRKGPDGKYMGFGLVTLPKKEAAPE
jgi:hypothetical protein